MPRSSLRSAVLLLSGLLLALASGCAKDGAKADAAAAASAAQHAAATAVPGSHEDWCGEHAVPESQCTRCNTSLVAAFKATGDWCAEHGLPKSQCTQCDPALHIERPAKGK